MSAFRKLRNSEKFADQSRGNNCFLRLFSAKWLKWWNESKTA